MGVGKVMLAGLALAGASIICSRTPPHEGRVQYFMEHPGVRLADYTPYFEKTILYSNHQLVSVASYSRTRDGIEGFTIADAMKSDGEADVVILRDGSQWGKCLARVPRLPEDLQERVQRHYEFSTRTWYRALQDDGETVRGLLGQSDFETLLDVCREVGQ